MKKTITLTCVTICVATTSAFAGLADINFGSASAAGAAGFYGTDAAAADSITLGYFTGTANAELTGWVVLGTDSNFEQAPIGFNTGFLDDVDTTAGDGSDAWLLVSDGSDFGLLRANDWVDITGATNPSPPSPLSYQFDSGDSAAGISTLGNIVIADGGGAGGSGISATVTAVPEPSTFAALAGFLALGCVALRRRK